MPTTPGRSIAHITGPVPVAAPWTAGGNPGGPLNQIDWIDAGSPTTIDGAQQTPLMRGTGGALAWWHKRQVRGPATVMQGAPFWLQSRPYSRGAQAFAPKFGVIPVNPIGSGVYAPHKLPPFAGPGARYQFGAIWFNVQAIPTTVRMSPTMPVESINALLAQSHVAAMYATTG